MYGCVGAYCWLIVVTIASAQDAAVADPAKEIAAFAARCESARETDSSVLGWLDLIEYQAGAMPLILASPHGGTKAPAGIAARTEGTLVTDSNTDALTREVANRIAELSGARPHVIICHLQRKYMDANRPLEAACASDSAATRTWHEYQQALLAAKQHVTKTSGRGLFIELHGHGHTNQRLEIGYLLRERDFELPLEEFEKLKAKSSVREIAERGQMSFEELIRGKSSLGGLLEQQGVAAVPGLTMRSPGKDEYFNGGWNTMTHGSRDAGTISSVQIECHRVGFRDSKKNIAKAAEQLAGAIMQFHKLHYAPASRATETGNEK